MSQETASKLLEHLVAAGFSADFAA